MLIARRAAWFAASVCALAGGAALLQAQEGSNAGGGAGAKTTVKGEVVDLRGFLEDEACHGRSYADACRKAIEQGSPVGILAEDGKVYLVLGIEGRKAADLAKDAAASVEATGTVHERGGVRGIALTSVKPAKAAPPAPPPAPPRRGGSGE